MESRHAVSDDALDDAVRAAMLASLGGAMDGTGRPPPRGSFEPPRCRACNGPIDVADEYFYNTRIEAPLDCPGCHRARLRARDVARCLQSVPEAYAWAAQDAPELAARVPRLRDVLARVGALLRAPRVVFTGPAGSGKTTLAVALLRRALAEGLESGEFAHAYRLATARARYPLGSGEAPLVESALRVRLLLLDDLGSERRTELSAVPDVIFERHADERPTWVTTGLGLDAIAARYGDGVARRIFERAEIVDLGGTP